MDLLFCSQCRKAEIKKLKRNAFNWRLLKNQNYCLGYKYTKIYLIKITINHELRIFSDSLFLIFISYLFFYYYLNIAAIFEALTDVTKTENGERGYADGEGKNETCKKAENWK